MSTGLRILITNNGLANRAGSELFVRDLALGLMRRGHSPIAYSSTLGAVADELERRTVPVVDDLASVATPPDVIHAQHHLDAMCALLRFPQVPALYMCHGWLPWQELPPVFPSIVRYVAVDDLCHERLLTTPGVPADRILTVYNTVDLQRFRPRGPLPRHPRAALIFSNYASDAFVGTVRLACREFGIDRVDVIGRTSGNNTATPEHVLPDYDVVFAKARCALEAMAVGCAVIVADFPGLGGMVAPDNMKPMRRLNFGVRTMQASPVTVETVLRELGRFDPDRSREVTAFIRTHADAERSLDQLETLYHEVRDERVEWSADEGLKACAAASSYLTGLVELAKTRADVVSRSQGQIATLSAEVHQLRNELSATATTLSALERSRTWRLFDPYRRARAWFARR